MKLNIIGVFRSLAAVFLGLSIALLMVLAIGESPILVIKTLFGSAFGSPYDTGMTLFYMCPLVLTGASVFLAFRCGLFNIGAEGQLMMGAMAATIVGIVFPGLPSILAIPFAIIAAFFGGAVWGAIPGFLKAYRGSHEVINTIMLNFIASALTSYLTLYWFKNPNTQNPETSLIGDGFRFKAWSFFETAPLGSALIVVLLVVIAVWFLFRFTVLGFQLRATGANESAARMSGISSKKMMIVSMTLAGGIAGLVAVPEVLGNAFRFKMGFSADYGFIGIAVALLARKNPFALIPAALLFAVLHKGATSLDLETEKVTKDFAYILQGIIILWVGAEGLWNRLTDKALKKVGAS